MLHFIFGGIHLDGRKEGTRRKPLALLEVEPEEVVIPTSADAGDVCEPMAAPGDRVCVGQPIARSAQGDWFIHASVSGQVTAVEPRPHPMGKDRMSVVIRNDRENRLWEQCPEQEADYTAMEEQEIIRRIQQAGVTGMGGVGYPTGAKILHARGRVDTLIVNAAESEPYVTADHRLLLELGEDVLTGVQILMKALNVTRGVVAVEGNKLNATEILERKVKRTGAPVRVCTVPSRYPLGAEKQVIKSVTGREIPPEGGPLDVGCVVFNVATAYAVYQAVVKGRPLTHRIVTVTGAAVARPRNLWVPIGTPMCELIKSAGGFRETPDLVLMGGPMKGLSQKNLNAPVIKRTNSLVCMASWEHEQKKQESVCIRCGRCVSACPMHLMPLLVDKELKLGGDIRELRRLHTEDCMGCGCCTYVCPASIPLVERMAQARQLVAQAEEKKEVAL